MTIFSEVSNLKYSKSVSVSIVITQSDAIGNAVFYIFYVVWYFGCFNLAALVYGDYVDQSFLRNSCMTGVRTELTHTYTLNYSDLTLN